MTSANRTSSPPLRRSPPSKERPWPLASLSDAELAPAFAQALDLGEGRPMGHAARVCYIASALAQALGLSTAARRAVFYGALFHDIGAAPASAELCRLLDLNEETVFATPRPDQSPHQIALQIAPLNATVVVELLRSHPERGAQVARELGFEAAVQDTIASHHERWDGHGYPRALRAEAIPVAARIVAAADLIESFIGGEANPLAARRNFIASLSECAGQALEPGLVDAAHELARDDTFWLGLHDEHLPQALVVSFPDAQDAPRSPERLRAYASVFATLADAKGEHTTGHSQRTADLALPLAARLGLDVEQQELIYLAALLHDIGLLGVPARIIAKPHILSLTEMQVLRKHPTYSQMVLEGLPGLHELARWVGAHHERPDGKGYPELLEGDTIPLEARILAVADTYVALTSPRPYRRALGHKDAQQVLLGGAGTQFDGEIVRALCSLSPRPMSARIAPRSPRRR